MLPTTIEPSCDHDSDSDAEAEKDNGNKPEALIIYLCNIKYIIYMYGSVKPGFCYRSTSRNESEYSFQSKRDHTTKIDRHS